MNTEQATAALAALSAAHPDTDVLLALCVAAFRTESAEQDPEGTEGPEFVRDWAHRLAFEIEQAVLS